MPDIATMHRGPALPGLLSSTPGQIAVFLTFCLSGIVFVEPAPYDLALIALTVVFLAAGLKLPPTLLPCLVLLSLWVIGGMIATPSSAHFKDSSVFIAVTAYLAVGSVFIASYVHRNPAKALPLIFNGYAIGAVIAALAGIAGYFGLFDGAYDMFTLYGRAKGPFKDPNVFAPFLIPPLVFCVERMFRSTPVATLAYGAASAILSLAILLSFSRGAWGHLVLTFAIAMPLLFMTERSNAYRLRMGVMTGLACAAVFLGFALLLNLTDIGKLLAERAQLVQAYDAGGHGRFDGQIHAIGLILTSPLGIGARDFSTLWGEEVHNVFLNTFLNSGWLGGFAYFSLVVLTLAKLVSGLTLRSSTRVYAIIVLASFLGLAAEGLLVDTDHWRHFFLLVGIAWGLPLPGNPLIGQARRLPTGN